MATNHLHAADQAPSIPGSLCAVQVRVYNILGSSSLPWKTNQQAWKHGEEEREKRVGLHLRSSLFAEKLLHHLPPMELEDLDNVQVTMSGEWEDAETAPAQILQDNVQVTTNKEWVDAERCTLCGSSPTECCMWTMGLPPLSLDEQVAEFITDGMTCWGNPGCVEAGSGHKYNILVISKRRKTGGGKNRGEVRTWEV